MNIKTDMPSAEVNGDLVLQEVWSAKDTLSAAYGHDLEKLVEETRKHEKLSGPPLVKYPPISSKR